MLAGAGVANLAAWVAVARARTAGRAVCLTAELGLWDYTPTPADPYIFNHRVFPGRRCWRTRRRSLAWWWAVRARRPSDAWVRPRSTAGNIDSTRLGDGRFLVGSGGANDVASRAAACVVITLGRPARLPENGRPL